MEHKKRPMIIITYFILDSQANSGVSANIFQFYILLIKYHSHIAKRKGIELRSLHHWFESSYGCYNLLYFLQRSDSTKSLFKNFIEKLRS